MPLLATLLAVFVHNFSHRCKDDRSTLAKRVEAVCRIARGFTVSYGGCDSCQFAPWPVCTCCVECACLKRTSTIETIRGSGSSDRQNSTGRNTSLSLPLHKCCGTMAQPSISPASWSTGATKYEMELLEMREQRELARKTAVDATEPPCAEGSREWLVRASFFMVSAFLIEALLWGTFFILHISFTSTSSHFSCFLSKYSLLLLATSSTAFPL
jgi:hypothetical protein